MLSLQAHVANRDNIRVTEKEKQKAEDKQRQLFLSAKEKMMKLRKDREIALLRYNPPPPRDDNSVVCTSRIISLTSLFFYPEPRSTEKAS